MRPKSSAYVAGKLKLTLRSGDDDWLALQEDKFTNVSSANPPHAAARSVEKRHIKEGEEE